MRPVLLHTLAALAAAVPLDTEHVARTPAPVEIRDTRSVESHLDTRGREEEIVAELRRIVDVARAAVDEAARQFGTASRQFREAVAELQRALEEMSEAIRSF